MNKSPPQEGFKQEYVLNHKGCAVLKTMPFASHKLTISFLRPCFRPDTGVLSQSPDWCFQAVNCGVLMSSNFVSYPPQVPRPFLKLPCILLEQEHTSAGGKNRKAKVQAKEIVATNCCVVYPDKYFSCVVSHRDYTQSTILIWS